MAHQIRTISAGRLGQRYGQLNDTALRREVAEKVLGHLGFSDLREVEEAEILADFPSLTREDIGAALAFAAARERRLAGSPTA